MRHQENVIKPEGTACRTEWNSSDVSLCCWC